MIRFLWPFVFLLLPLPLAVRRWLPPARPLRSEALRVPFFTLLSDLAGRRPGIWRGAAAAWTLWCLLLLAASRPQWLDLPDVEPVTGRDLMLVLDISGSMRTMDYEGDDGRLERLAVVKDVAGRFIDRRRGDRLGLILFGARPYLRAPLTYDHAVVKAMLEETEVALAGEYTAMGDAIGLAVKHMEGTDSDSRVIILLTDGANNAGNIGPRQAALIAAGEGIRIYTIGVGRHDASAPNPYGSWSVEGAAGFDREVLEAIASMTGGMYLFAGDMEALERAYKRLDELEPSLGEEIGDYFAVPLYPWPLAAALVLSLWMALPVRFFRRPRWN